ncbi:MAG TPA: DUF2516 family protein [Actinocrinis sp.]|nr:DUF2516 family protein [Actinocrinis sp.]
MGLGPGLITNTFFNVLNLLLLALLIFKVFAFVDALIRPGAAYEAAGKLTKVAWLLFLGLAAVADLLWGGVMSILTILGTIAAIVYMVDVRPAVRQFSGKSGAKNSQTGPYGPW